MLRALLILAAVAAATAQKKHFYVSESYKGFSSARDPNYPVQSQWEYKIRPKQGSAELIFPDEYNCRFDGLDTVPLLLSVEVLSDEEPAYIKIDADLRRVVIYRTTNDSSTLQEAFVKVKAHCIFNPLKSRNYIGDGDNDDDASLRSLKPARNHYK